jgi:hypothetical protein
MYLTPSVKFDYLSKSYLRNHCIKNLAATFSIDNFKAIGIFDEYRFVVHFTLFIEEVEDTGTFVIGNGLNRVIIFTNSLKDYIIFKVELKSLLFWY